MRDSESQILISKKKERNLQNRKSAAGKRERAEGFVIKGEIEIDRYWIHRVSEGVKERVKKKRNRERITRKSKNS